MWNCVEPRLREPPGRLMHNISRSYVWLFGHACRWKAVTHSENKLFHVPGFLCTVYCAIIDSNALRISDKWFERGYQL
jgi:hypothetical protein